MKVKQEHELIGKRKTITFYIEDVETNTLIYSDKFIITGKTDIAELEKDFVSGVLDAKRMEKAMLESKVHELKENKVTLQLPVPQSN